MLTSIRGVLAATLLAGTALAAAPALAQDTAPPSEITVSGSASVVTDYRFRGLSLSGGDPAIQGSIDVAHASGFYAGVWGSSISGGDRDIDLDDGTGAVLTYDRGSFGSAEIDLYAGWSGEVTSGVTVDVGLLYYYYPNGQDRAADFVGTGPSGYPVFTGYSDYPTDYFEPYASVSGAIGPATATLGVAYAWEQDALGGEDNVYVYGDLEFAVPNTPVSLAAHLGYADGVQSPKVLTGSGTGGGFDWSLGGTFAITPNLSIGATYVGVEGASIDGYSDDTVVGTLSVSF